jgi:hypothetical protein
MQMIDRSAFEQDLANASGKPASLPTQDFNQQGFGLVEMFVLPTAGRSAIPINRMTSS